MRVTVLGLIVGLSVAACGGDTKDPATIADAVADAAVVPDVPAPGDTAVEDMAVEDTAVEDTAAEDTAVEDTAIEDVADSSGCTPIGDEDGGGPPLPCLVDCDPAKEVARECVNGSWKCPAGSKFDCPPVQDCAATSESTLKGATIVITATDCTFTQGEAAAGVEIGYSVEIAEDLQDIISKPTDAGGCDQPGPSGLRVSEKLEGGEQSYCLCDVGLCMPPEQKGVTIKKGSYPASFKWDGVNWFGPSDFNNPKGPPFPPGTYTLTLRSTGSTDVPGVPIPFEIKATATVTILP